MFMQSKNRRRFLIAVGILPFLMYGISFISPVVFGQNDSDIPKGPHQAAIEEYQEKYLGELQKNSPNGNFIPSGIDKEYWNFFVEPGNETNEARVELGRKLYFDTRLSIDGTVSCATCHDVTRGFGDALPTSEGVDKIVKGNATKQFGTRNAPTTMNIAVLHVMFWDGRSPSIEHQAMQPIINPVEMGMPETESKIIAGIKDDPAYQAMFHKAYNREVNYKDIGNALAAFERTLVFMDNSFFRYLKGDANAISEDAKEGWKLFNREGRCNSCHAISPSNPLGTDNKYHNIGIAARKQNFLQLVHDAEKALATDTSEAALDKLALSTDLSELGRFLITKKHSDLGAFRTPMLLNVGITGPYMHDGSMKSLWEVIDHYNHGGDANLYLDGGIEPLNLTEQQVNQLVAFLFSLTDVRFADQNTQKIAEQKKLPRDDKRETVVTRKELLFENYDAAPQKTTGTEKGTSK